MLLVNRKQTMRREKPINRVMMKILSAHKHNTFQWWQQTDRRTQNKGNETSR